MSLQIVTREEWGAKVPRSRLNRIPTPTPELWLHHTAGNERGPAGIRQIEDYHVNVRGWRAVAYSFLIDPNLLLVYEGRGAGIAGGHTAGHNTTSHAICVMGRYDEVQPTEQLLHLIAELVRYGHARGWWPRHLTGGHRDASGASTACPGRWLHAQIPTINAWATKAPTPILEDDMRGLSAIDTVMRSIERIYRAYGRSEEALLWYDDIRKKLRSGVDINPTLEWIDDELARQAAK